MEHLAQLLRDGAVVGITRHHGAHISPPTLTFRRLGDGGPARVVLDFDVTEKLMRTRIEKDRVVVHTVGFKNLFQLRPDWAVTALVFGLLTGIDRHHEGFADHGGNQNDERWSGGKTTNALARGTSRQHSRTDSPIVGLIDCVAWVSPLAFVRPDREAFRPAEMTASAASPPAVERRTPEQSGREKRLEV